MKKHFHIQNTPMFPIEHLHLVWMNADVYNKTYSITYTASKTLIYKKEKLFIPRAMWFFYSDFPHGDILMGPRHQVLIINISHLFLSYLANTKHYRILSVWWQIRISVNGNECLYLQRVNSVWGICNENVFCVYHQFWRLNSLQHKGHKDMIQFI